MVVGVAVVLLIANVLEAEEPQALLAFTVIFPEMAPEPTVTVMLLVLEVPLRPEGNVQL